jgi:hypothetical protein
VNREHTAVHNPKENLSRRVSSYSSSAFSWFGFLFGNYRKGTANKRMNAIKIPIFSVPNKKDLEVKSKSLFVSVVCHIIASFMQ